MESQSINTRLNKFSWALAAILFLPLLFTKGMFFDGLTYASIARNLELGLGTWFEPHYTLGLHNTFYEHPPLSFIMHSVLYRLFGDHFWVDRLYPYIFYGISVLIIRRLWALHVPAAHRAWIPQLMFTLTPTVIWVHQHNMLEAPLGALTLITVWLMVEGSMRGKHWWSAIAAITLIAAAHIKGPVGLFPLITLPLIAVLYPEYRKNAFVGLTVFSITSGFVISLLVFYLPGYENNIMQYLDQQVLATLSGARGQSGSVLGSLWTLTKQLWVPVALFIVFRIKGGKEFQFNKHVLFFFTIALSATVPFLFLDKQHHYYFAPSMVYWMFAFAVLYQQHPWPWSFKRKKLTARMAYINMLLWVVAVVLALVYSKGVAQDRWLYKDLDAIAEVTGENVQIYAPDHMTDWRAQAYAQRYFRMSFMNNPDGCDYSILESDHKTVQGLVELRGDWILTKKAGTH